MTKIKITKIMQMTKIENCENDENKNHENFENRPMTAKKEFWLLLAVFVLPFVLGVLFFYFNPNYFAQNTTNHGKFVKPVIHIPQSAATLSAGKTLNGVWTLAYFGDCDDFCRATLEKMHTAKLMMGEEMARLQIITLGREISKPAENRNFQNSENLQNSKNLQNSQNSENLQNSQNLQNIPNAKIAQNVFEKLSAYPPQTVFLIDPLARVMLRYDARDFNIRHVVLDLRRLFKYSQIG